MKKLFRSFVVAAAALVAGAFASDARAWVMTFEAADFGLNPTFSNVQTFAFTIDIADPMVAGGVYNNPTLNSVVYNVFGVLAATPSGFPAFNLQRTIGGAEFYNQGSSLSFSISPTANIADGLHLSDLSGADPVLVFNGREVGTGRYHPALVELNADGTGLIRNSNNVGGVNPGSLQVVDVDIGDEYVTELTFDPNSLHLAQAPVPTGVVLALTGVAGLALLGLRNRRRA